MVHTYFSVAMAALSLLSGKKIQMIIVTVKLVKMKKQAKNFQALWKSNFP